MDNLKSRSVSELPDEMMSFMLTQFESHGLGPRLGRLLRHGRTPLQTPLYVATTSRGVVPHISQDVLQRHTSIGAAYIALEDFIEKAPQKAPIFSMPALSDESRLRKYIALPDELLSIIGPRRIPAIPCPTQNTNSTIAISTSVGFRHLEIDDYIEAVEELRPDIATGIGDIVTAETASVKRIEKSADRSHAWSRDMLAACHSGSTASSAIFASIPPIEKEQMLFYLNDLREEFKPQISGLAIYDLDTVNAIPKEISHLPRLCLCEPSSPHALLHAISLGTDLITVPFVTTFSEHGIAFSFTFDSSKELSDQSLGLDLWSTDHVTDLSPLHPSCKCYACTRHHRAYVHHLLHAKEMLGWTLISIHNYAMMDVFFEGVRASIASNTFDEDVEAFTRTYGAAMPEKTGEGPRIRGYQTKSVGGGEPKKNAKAYGRLDDAVQKLEEAESGIATPTGDAGELEEHGFAEKTD